MSATTTSSWYELDRATRRRLDAEYLRDLSWWDVPGLTGQAVRAYLRYRHERPDAAITTYEEGRIRALMRPYLTHDEETRPLRWTAETVYVGVMVGLVLTIVTALLVVVSML